MSDKIEKLKFEVMEKTVQYNDAMATAERLEESIKILNHRISLLTGQKVWDTYELDVTNTVQTIELARHVDRGDWAK
jgi:hypothetical protein